jgi:predicted permease
VDAVAVNLAVERPGSYRTGPVRLSFERVEAAVGRGARPALVAAAGAVALVMVVACANLTNLLLARASARARDIGIRVAIGAGPRDIVRQLVVEGLVLGSVGAAGGWVAAQWGVAGLVGLAPAGLPRREAISIDGIVTVFAIGLALLCAVSVSLVPSWQAVRTSIRPALTREPARAARMRGLLVAAQLALSIVLLVGTTLMIRTFVALQGVPLGFDARHAATMLVALSDERFNVGTIDEARALRRMFYEQLAEEVSDLPGVHAAGTGFPAPLSGTTLTQRVSLGPAQAEREVDGFVALGGYLEALDVPLLAGRYFTRADNARPVVIVDERLGRELWPERSAVGERLLIVKSLGAPQWAEVVGVVSHVQARGLRDPGPPQVWMTYGVRAPAQLNLAVRAADPSSAVLTSANTVRTLGAGRPVRDVSLLSDSVDEATAEIRFALFVIGVLAVLAAVLAAVGVYSVVAYAMSQRRRELAVRLALGASRRRLVALALGESAFWMAAGLALGLAGAAALSRFLDALLFQVGRHDALTFSVVASVTGVVALVAAFVPALRASRVDPMLALRGE